MEARQSSDLKVAGFNPPVDMLFLLLLCIYLFVLIGSWNRKARKGNVEISEEISETKPSHEKSRQQNT
jgi:hypothetical protein